MGPVARALWYIESHSESPITLDEVAAAAHVSRYHLARTFAVVTGVPVMAYVRGRRLSRAARRLAEGAPDILAVALDAAYNSHEAFTRAFREQFGLTPEALRSQGTLANITLVEMIQMEATNKVQLDEPKYENGREMLLAGLSERMVNNCAQGIPAQWQRFGPYIGRLATQLGPTCYGIVLSSGDGGEMDYMAAVEVSSFAGLPPELRQVKLAPQRYAVFRHTGHISGVGATWAAVMDGWLPAASVKAADAPYLERYGPEFNPRTGQGGLDLMIPIAG